MRFTQTNVNSLKPPAGKSDHDEIDDAMPGFGIRFRNGGSGTYFIKYKIGSKHGRLSLGKVTKVTLAAAQAAAKKQFAAIAEKVDPAVERAKAVSKASNTITPLIPDFIDYLTRNGRSLSYLAENTRSLNQYFKTLHRFSAADINRAMVAKELSKIRADRGPISADRSRAHLSKFFSWAIADDDYGAICRLLILTGCRRDEIGSLSRSEINFAQKQVELPGSRTKSGADHIIPLSPMALSILKAREPRQGSDFVFGRGEGGFSGWSQSKERLDQKLDLDDWVLHDFRRTLSTVMHDKLRVPPHIVEAVLGHISGHRSGVGGVYNKAAYTDAKRKALDAWASFLQSTVGGKKPANVVALRGVS
jgi:integrase